MLVYSNSAIDPMVYFFKNYLGMILQKREALKNQLKNNAKKSLNLKMKFSRFLENPLCRGVPLLKKVPVNVTFDL